MSTEHGLLERLAAEYPLSPEMARLKAAVLFAGVRYDPCLAEAGKWAFRAYAPFMLPHGVPSFEGKRQVWLPYLLRLADDTQVRLRVKQNSEFVIRAEHRDGVLVFVLYAGERPVIDLTFEPRLPWVDLLTADGTPMKATGLSQHGDMLVLNVAPGCEYFVAPPVGGTERTRNLSCKFCLYGVPDQRMKPLGQQLYVPEMPEATLRHVAEACGHPETHARHLYLVGGSMLDIEQEGRRYVQIARHLAEAGLMDRYYVAAGSGAIRRQEMLELKDAGVKGACFNLEVWDPVQFKRVCPGKAEVVGREAWIESLQEAVEVFGRGHVMTAFVGGAELDGPGCIEDPAEALEGNLEACEVLTPMGIQPIWSLHWKVTGKNRGEEPFYSLDQFLKLNEGAAALRKQHDLPINTDFFCRRCAYMQLEPDYDLAQFGDGAS